MKKNIDNMDTHAELDVLLHQILEDCRPYTANGVLADYIPELAKKIPTILESASLLQKASQVPVMLLNFLRFKALSSQYFLR